MRCDEREFLPEVKSYDVRCTLGVNFSRHVLAKLTATMQRINAPSIFNLMPSNLAVHKIIAANVNRPGEF